MCGVYVIKCVVHHTEEFDRDELPRWRLAVSFQFHFLQNLTGYQTQL